MPERRWFAHARQFQLMPSTVRETFSRDYRSHMKAIARLPAELGEQLDELGFALSDCRYVARGKGYAAQSRRFLARRAALEARARARARRSRSPDIDESSSAPLQPRANAR